MGRLAVVAWERVGRNARPDREGRVGVPQSVDADLGEPETPDDLRERVRDVRWPYRQPVGKAPSAPCGEPCRSAAKVHGRLPLQHQPTGGR